MMVQVISHRRLVLCWNILVCNIDKRQNLKLKKTKQSESNHACPIRTYTHTQVLNDKLHRCFSEGAVLVREIMR